jgi:predicted phage tail protein
MTQELYKQKRSLELDWEQEYNESGKYTLNMVLIDDKIKEVITQIKLEEAKVAHRVNKIEEAQAEVSIAT